MVVKNVYGGKMISNQFIKNQSQIMDFAFEQMDKYKKNNMLGHKHMAQDYAHQFIYSAQKSPTVAMAIEQNKIKNNTQMKKIWNSLKSKAEFVQMNLQETINNAYPNTKKLRTKLVKNNRLNLDKVLPKMNTLEKFLFKVIK